MSNGRQENSINEVSKQGCHINLFFYLYEATRICDSVTHDNEEGSGGVEGVANENYALISKAWDLLLF